MTSRIRCVYFSVVHASGFRETGVGNRHAVLWGMEEKDPRFKDSDSLARFHIRSMMCAPLLTPNRVLGVVHIDTTSRRAAFTQDDLDLLVSVAAQVSIALKNAALHEEHVNDQRLAAVGQAVAGLAHCVKNVLQGVMGGSRIVDKALAASDLERLNKGWSTGHSSEGQGTELRRIA